MGARVVGWRATLQLRSGGRSGADGHWVLQLRVADRSTPLSGTILCRRPRGRARSTVSDLACGAAATAPRPLMTGAGHGSSDRKSVVQGKSVDLGGRRIIKKNSSQT